MMEDRGNDVSVGVSGNTNVDRGNTLWSVFWFFFLIIFGYSIAGFCGGLHLLFQPFSVCIHGCTVRKIKRGLFRSFKIIFPCFETYTEHPRYVIERIPSSEILRREDGCRQRWTLKDFFHDGIIIVFLDYLCHNFFKCYKCERNSKQNAPPSSVFAPIFPTITHLYKTQ